MLIVACITKPELTTAGLAALQGYYHGIEGWGGHCCCWPGFQPTAKHSHCFMPHAHDITLVKAAVKMLPLPASR